MILSWWDSAQSVLQLYQELLAVCFSRKTSRRKEIVTQIVQIGLESLPIIAVSTAFAGLVVSHEIAWHMHQALSNVQMVPGFTGQFIMRELGVAIPALLVVSKVGASIAAETSTMKVTEQIDALRLLQIDPVEYLVYPRWVGCIFSLVCLTLISITITLGCSVFVAVVQFHFSALEYLNILQKFVRPSDILSAIIKSATFGAVIPVLSCWFGFRCKGGAEGVGTATTEAVVASTIAVIVLDFILTYLFTLFLY